MTRLRRVRCSMAASNVHGEEGRRPASPQRLWGILFPPSHPRLLFLSVDVVPRPGKSAHVRQTCLFLVFLFYCVLLWQRGRAGPGRLNSTHCCLPLVFVYRRKNKQKNKSSVRNGDEEAVSQPPPPPPPASLLIPYPIAPPLP